MNKKNIYRQQISKNASTLSHAKLKNMFLMR